MATVSIETTSQWGELIKGVGVQFMDVFDQKTNSYTLEIEDVVAVQGNKATALCKMENVDGQQVHFTGKSGTNFLQVTAQGAAFATDSRFLLYKTSITPQKFTSSVTCTYESIQDRDYKSLLDEFGDLGISGKETMDRSFYDMLNYAFTAQASLPTYIYGYGDAKPLCSVSHPRKDGGAAQLNTFATATTQLPLTDTNLEAARILLNRQLDDRGKPTRIGGGKLILAVPFELEKTAAIITRAADGGKRSGTANNDVNIYDGFMTVVASKWLAYTGNGGSLPTTAWFLIDPRVAKLYMLIREGLRTHQFTDPNTLNTTFYVLARWAVAWTDWRGLFGSLGDSSAYAS